MCLITASCICSSLGCILVSSANSSKFHKSTKWQMTLLLVLPLQFLPPLLLQHPPPSIQRSPALLLLKVKILKGTVCQTFFKMITSGVFIHKKCCMYTPAWSPLTNNYIFSYGQKLSSFKRFCFKWHLPGTNWPWITGALCTAIFSFALHTSHLHALQ